MAFQQLKKQLVEAYNHKAEERNQLNKDGWKIIERAEFLALLKEGQTLLEIGAGPGHDSLFFKENGLQVTSIDISPEMVKICQEKGLRAHVMSFDKLSFPDNSFHAVWALNCLLHVPKEELPTVLQEVKRVLKPGGHFYWGVYGGRDSEGIWEDDFYIPKRFFSFYTDESIQQVGRNYFDLYSFKTLSKEEIGNNDHHFQSMIWKQKEV